MAASTHRLRTLGTLDLRAPDGTELRAVLAQPRRIALLAYLAVATPRGPQRRDRLLSLFWPDQDEAHARNALSQAIHFLRRSLGTDVITGRTGEELAIDPALLWCDAVAFDDAVAGRRTLEAAELYRGELLAGFHVPGASAELSSWLETTRAEYGRRHAAVLREIAEERERAGDFASAVDWRRRLAAHDPLDAAAALALMRALAASGDAAGAIRHSRVHDALVRDELDATPDPRVGELAKTLEERPDALRRPAAPPSAVAASVPSLPDPLARAPAESAPPVRPRPARRRQVTVALAAGLAVVAAVGSFIVTGARTSVYTPDCIAVLPLANYSGNRADADVADALTDALITELARYERLSVISRSSVTRYKGTREPLPQIARELHCGAALSGSISRDGERLLVNAQIMDAAADRLRWAERYTRSPSELPVLERDISEAVAAQLGAATRPASAADADVDPRAIRAVDPLTYGIYLRGRDAILSRDPAGLQRAVGLFQQALLRDSTFALGWAGLADAWRLAGGLGYIPETFCFDSAPAAARRALALDGQLSEAHSSLAGTLTDAADWTHAEVEFRRAIALEPGNALAHQWYAAMLITLDRRDEALHEARRGIQLDPLSQAARGLEGSIEGYEGIHSPKAARNAAHGPPRSAMIDPNHPGTRAWRAVTFARLGRCADAYAESDTAQMLAPDVAMILIARAGVDKLCGHLPRAMAEIARVKTHPEVYLSGVYMAEFYTAIGERDSAFAWLDRTHYGMASRMDLRIASALDPLRGDPRFRALLQREHM